MQGWQTSYLGLRDLPRELSEFELQAFFSFGRNELELIARRRGDNHKLGLALHIGFVRMSGRPLNSVRAVPAVLLRHLDRCWGSRLRSWRRCVRCTPAAAPCSITSSRPARSWALPG